MLTSKSFIALALTSRSVIHFELILVYVVKIRVQCFDMLMSSFLPPFVEGTVLSLLNGLGILVKIS